MPYIDVISRQRLEKHPPETMGELTYVLYKACRHYINKEKKGYKYQQLAEVLAALEAAKLEFYARVVRPYEDIKIKANGDVF